MLHIINPISDTSYNYRGVASSQGFFFFLSKNNIIIIMAIQLGPWIIDRVAAHQGHQLQVRGVPLYYIIHCSSMHLQVSSASSSDSEELSSPMTIPTPSWRTGRPLMLDTRIRSWGPRSSSISLPSNTLFNREVLRLGEGERAPLRSTSWGCGSGWS